MLYDFNVDLVAPEVGTIATARRKLKGLLVMHADDHYMDVFNEDIIEREGDEYVHALVECDPETAVQLAAAARDIDGVAKLTIRERSERDPHV